MMKKVKRTKGRRTPRRNSFLPLAIGMSGGIALAGAAFWFFEQQAEYVVEGRADKFDTALLELVGKLESPKLNQTMGIVTHLGSHAAIGTAAGVTALAMLWRGRNHDASTVMISTGGAMVINTALKAIFQRQRPKELARKIKLPKSHSFPSGHSLLAAATYPIVIHHLVEDLPPGMQMTGHAVSTIIILAVGFSRVYFAVHFPSDVLAGFAAGFGWLGLTSLTHTLFDRPRLTAAGGDSGDPEGIW